jgi:hypothetical protein
VTREPQHLKDKLNKLKCEISKDRLFKDIPSVKSLGKKGFHYCEDEQTIKPLVINLIAELPFEAYICYRPKEVGVFDNSNSFDWYDQLFGKLLHDRLRKHKRELISICFEQHSNSVMARKRDLEGIVKRLVHEIERKDSISSLPVPMVKSAGKEEPCLAIADYVAAIFKDYEYVRKVGTDKEEILTSWQARQFFAVQSKIRVIHNYETGEFFTRRNPFM